MKKDSMGENEIKLRLERIKISHKNELAYISRKTWLKVTIIFGALITIFTALSRVIPQNYIIPVTFVFLAYLLLLLDVANYALKKDFYGKPKRWYGKIFYYLFLDFLFSKEEGIMKKYENEIDRLIKKLK